MDIHVGYILDRVGAATSSGLARSLARMGQTAGLGSGVLTPAGGRTWLGAHNLGVVIYEFLNGRYPVRAYLLTGLPLHFAL